MKLTAVACLVLVCASVVTAQPYPVGHRSITYVDAERGNRNVSTEVYYPATAAGDNTPVAVPPVDGFPVISFGHGFLLPTSTYQYLWNALVPQGFIVALPNTESGFAPSHQQFGLDLAFLVQKLRSEGDNDDSPFFGAVAQTACVMGHSMGGGASFLAAQSDSTITAIANLAAAETNPSAIAAAAEIEIPALVFAASGDCVTPPADHQIPMYDALASDCKMYVNITGGSHCKFGENNFTCNLGELTCSGAISRATQHQIVLTHLVPFLKYHLQNIEGANCEFLERLEEADGITWERICAPLPAPTLSIAFTGSDVSLRWNAVPGACGYDLLRGADADFGYDPQLIIFSGTGTAFTEPPIMEQTVYRVWAK